MDFYIYRLGELFTRFSSGKNLTSEKIFDKGEYPVYGGNGLRGYTSEYNFDGECIIIGRQGAKCGNIHYFNGKGYMTDHAIVGVSKNGHDSRFLSYALTALDLNRLSGQAAQPGLAVSMLKKQKIQLPSSENQFRIAEIISVYDNLIDTNNKRIKLLEQMAENLYKEWFVRFRFPGYENTKFVDGIPSDWQILRMSDFCYVTDGTHDTPKPINDGGVPLVTGKCIKNGFIDFNESYNISYQDHESISKRSGLQTGDILFSNIGTVGTTCLVNYDREFSVKNVIIFKPDNIKVSNYLYSWLNSDSIQAIFATQTNGASQQFVGLNFMRRFKILVPNENVLDSYSGRVKPIRTEIVKLHDINENLTKQRDMLLPRLMSGKLEV
jgi:restriction modification system DNA specificity domain protein